MLPEEGVCTFFIRESVLEDKTEIFSLGMEETLSEFIEQLAKKLDINPYLLKVEEVDIDKEEGHTPISDTELSLYVQQTLTVRELSKQEALLILGLTDTQEASNALLKLFSNTQYALPHLQYLYSIHSADQPTIKNWASFSKEKTAVYLQKTALLIAAGAKYKERLYNDRYSFFDIAASTHSPELMKMLLKYDAPFFTSTYAEDTRKTALHHAVIKNNLPAITLLCAYQADNNALCSAAVIGEKKTIDLSALDLAIYYNATDIINFLINHKNTTATTIQNGVGNAICLTRFNVLPTLIAHKAVDILEEKLLTHLRNIRDQSLHAIPILQEARRNKRKNSFTLLNNTAHTQSHIRAYEIALKQCTHQLAYLNFFLSITAPDIAEKTESIKEKIQALTQYFWAKTETEERNPLSTLG